MRVSISKIMCEVLDQISPTAQEKKKEITFARGIMKKLKQVTNARIVLTGSIAKGTFLKNSADLDVFVLFARSVERADFRTRIERIVKRAFPKKKFILSYAEHPYVRLILAGKRVDIVPAYAITHSGQRGSAVDRSVLHTKFILESLTDAQKNQVRLLKKFLRSAELYGAEIKIRGFSGYACELLIFRYGTFLGALRAATDWKPPVFIAIERAYRKKEERGTGIKRFLHPLIVIDPTDKNRNVTAAVSEENMVRFMRIARSFIKNPSARFFGAPKTFEEKIARVRNSYIVRIKKPTIVDDILWGQIRRFERTLGVFLKHHDFQIKQMLADAGTEVTIVVQFKDTVLPDKKVLAGPLLKFKENTRQFKRAHTGATFMVKNKRMYAVVKRKIKTAENALEKFFKTAELPSHLDKETVKIQVHK